MLYLFIKRKLKDLQKKFACYFYLQKSFGKTLIIFCNVLKADKFKYEKNRQPVSH